MSVIQPCWDLTHPDKWFGRIYTSYAHFTQLFTRIHKDDLFEICGLFKSMDWNRHEIRVSCPCAQSLLDLSLLYAMDHAYFTLISAHGLTINHRFEISHLCEFGPISSIWNCRVHINVFKISHCYCEGMTSSTVLVTNCYFCTNLVHGLYEINLI